MDLLIGFLITLNVTGQSPQQRLGGIALDEGIGVDLAEILGDAWRAPKAGYGRGVLFPAD